MSDFTCRSCGNTKDFYPIPRLDTPHGDELICGNCKAHVKWMKKEKNKNKRIGSRFSPALLEVNYCEVCLRQRARLGRHETLDIHHKIEIQDGGKDERDNVLVVCTHCHKLIHHVRCYMNDAFGDLWEHYEELKSAMEQKELSTSEYEDKVITTMHEIEKAPWEE
jgi:hypothetical protein